MPRRETSRPEPGALDTGQENGLPVLRAAGEFDLRNAMVLRDGLTEAAGATRVVLDMSAVTFIDSTAIGAMLAGLRAVETAGGQLVVRNPSRRVQKVLQITGLTG